jgi:hypothetical protein
MKRQAPGSHVCSEYPSNLDSFKLDRCNTFLIVGADKGWIPLKQIPFRFGG